MSDCVRRATAVLALFLPRSAPNLIPHTMPQYGPACHVARQAASVTNRGAARPVSNHQLRGLDPHHARRLQDERERAGLRIA